MANPPLSYVPRMPELSSRPMLLAFLVLGHGSLAIGRTTSYDYSGTFQVPGFWPIAILFVKYYNLTSRLNPGLMVFREGIVTFTQIIIIIIKHCNIT